MTNRESRSGLTQASNSPRAPGKDSHVRRTTTTGRTSTGKPAPPDRKKLRQMALAALSEPIPPIATTMTYRLGILATTFVMLLLPLIYVLLIAGVIGLIGYHAAANGDWVTETEGSIRGRLLLYLAPIVIGVLLVLFMLKPIFARPGRHARPRRLDPKKEPFLFAFVDELCSAVGAPSPREIQVDCQVNASASFRRGLLSFFSRDLVLTIGVPLVAGMTLPQMAGILAHEFGHFTQGSGMRLTYIIRSINYWFQRVVYERDAWDERIVSWSKTIDLRLSIILFPTRLLIWLTRKILWLLMMIGHGVASYMLREMEYDADRCEARLSGSKTFAVTCRRLNELGLAHRFALDDLGDAYREGKLADDIPALIVARVSDLPEAAHQAISKNIKVHQTGWFDSHPSDADRIASAAREEAAGLFAINAPASLLFSQYQALCKAVSLDFYRSIFGRKFDKNLLHSTSQLVERSTQTRDQYEALNRFFQGTFHPLRPVILNRWQTAVPESRSESFAQLKRLRSELLQITPEHTKFREKYDEAAAKLLSLHVAGTIHKSGGRVTKEQFGIDLSSPQRIRDQIGKIKDRKERLDARLQTFDSTMAERLQIALDLTRLPVDNGSSLDESAANEKAIEVDQLLVVARRICELGPSLVKMRTSQAVMGQLFETFSDKTLPPEAVTEIQKRMHGTANLLHKMREPLEKLAYPFDHGKDTLTVAEFLYKKDPDPANPAELYSAGQAMGEGLCDLSGRLFGALAIIAEREEKALGLEPLPLPETMDAKQKSNAGK